MKYLIRLKKKEYCSYCHWLENTQNVNIEMEIDDSIIDVKWYLYQAMKEKYPNLKFYGQYHKVYEKLPNGWKRLNGTLTAPNGYYWASNGKSFFDKNIERALIYEN